MTNRKNWLLVALGILAFLNGAVSQYTAHGMVLSPSDMVFMLAATVLIFTWYYVDAKQINYRRSPLLDIGIIAICLIALPYYFLRSRGFKKSMLYTGALILVVIAWSLLVQAGAYAVYYGMQH